MTAHSDSFTPQEFIDKLRSDDLKGPLTLTGMVKVNEDSADELMFAVGNHCADWRSVPLDAIENVEVLGTVPCKDHTHHSVKLTFKPPASPEGAMFASLLSAAAKRETLTRVMRAPQGAVGLRDSGCPCSEYEIDANGVIWQRVTCDQFGDGTTICTYTH